MINLVYSISLYIYSKKHISVYLTVGEPDVSTIKWRMNTDVLGWSLVKNLGSVHDGLYKQTNAKTQKRFPKTGCDGGDPGLEVR